MRKFSNFPPRFLKLTDNLHWCKVDVNKIEPEVLDAIIKRSFDITAPKKRVMS